MRDHLLFAFLVFTRYTFCFVIIFSVSSITSPALSQEYSYAHYNVKNGLAGSTANDLLQDNDPVVNPFNFTFVVPGFVENNIQHNTRNKKTGMGRIDIKFTQNSRELICIVENNGIGRWKANELKSAMHIEYQSKGMTITNERINILNRQTTNPLFIEVIDLTGSDNLPTGAKVVIR